MSEKEGAACVFDMFVTFQNKEYFNEAKDDESFEVFETKDPTTMSHGVTTVDIIYG